MDQAYICDAVRTPFGRYGGALSTIRTDDLAALPIRALVERNAKVDWAALDDVIYGCANQAGEDNRNVGRMALLLAGLPKEVPGVTVNRLCGSSMEAVANAARAIKSGELAFILAGGVESMSRAPFVIGKADAAFSRSIKLEDTTIGWRFVNPAMKARYGVDLMPETAEIVAEEFRVSRQDQDAFALRSQQRAAAAMRSGRLAKEIVPVAVPQKKGDPVLVSQDEQPRPDTNLEALAKLKGVVKPDGTVTAGNSSGINDGACALLIASEAAARQHGLQPRARVDRFGCCRGCAADYGYRPRAGDAQSSREGESEACGHERNRTERSFRVASARRSSRLGNSGRRAARQSERRSNRHRAPAGSERRAIDHDSAISIGANRRPIRAVHHVHRRGPGYRGNFGESLPLYCPLFSRGTSK